MLHWSVEAMDTMPRAVIVLFVYLIVLVMNFFISSGSAKAFLLIPLIVPMAQLFSIEPQLCVLAFAFGDKRILSDKCCTVDCAQPYKHQLR